MSDSASCETPMSDHIESFWNLLANEHVRILIDIRRDHDEGQPPHWDSASFPNDVAKALVAQRGTSSVMICGACGDIWQDGMSCGQKDNGHPYPTCYPVARS